MTTNAEIKRQIGAAHNDFEDATENLMNVFQQMPTKKVPNDTKHVHEVIQPVLVDHESPTNDHKTQSLHERDAIPPQDREEVQEDLQSEEYDEDDDEEEQIDSNDPSRRVEIGLDNLLHAAQLGNLKGVHEAADMMRKAHLELSSPENNVVFATDDEEKKGKLLDVFQQISDLIEEQVSAAKELAQNPLEVEAQQRLEEITGKALDPRLTQEFKRMEDEKRLQRAQQLERQHQEQAEALKVKLEEEKAAQKRNEEGQKKMIDDMKNKMAEHEKKAREMQEMFEKESLKQQVQLQNLEHQPPQSDGPDEETITTPVRHKILQSSVSDSLSEDEDFMETKRQDEEKAQRAIEEEKRKLEEQRMREETERKMKEDDEKRIQALKLQEEALRKKQDSYRRLELEERERMKLEEIRKKEEQLQRDSEEAFMKEQEEKNQQLDGQKEGERLQEREHLQVEESTKEQQQDQELYDDEPEEIEMGPENAQEEEYLEDQNMLNSQQSTARKHARFSEFEVQESELTAMTEGSDEEFDIEKDSKLSMEQDSLLETLMVFLKEGNAMESERAAKKVLASVNNLIKSAKDSIEQLDEEEQKLYKQELTLAIHELELAAGSPLISLVKAICIGNSKPLKSRMDETKVAVSRSSKKIHSVMHQWKRERLKKLEAKLSKEISADKRKDLMKQIELMKREMKSAYEAALAKRKQEELDRLKTIQQRKMLLKLAKMDAEYAKNDAMKKRQEQIAREKDEMKLRMQEKQKEEQLRREELRKRIVEEKERSQQVKLKTMQNGKVSINHSLPLPLKSSGSGSTSTDSQPDSDPSRSLRPSTATRLKPLNRNGLNNLPSSEQDNPALGLLVPRYANRMIGSKRPEGVVKSIPTIQLAVPIQRRTHLTPIMNQSHKSV